MTFPDFLARARAIRASHDLTTTDPAQEFDGGAVLTFALFLRRERVRHLVDVRQIDEDLAAMRTAIPWLGPALDSAEPLGHVEVG